MTRKRTVAGVGPDAPTVTNDRGASQSHIPYRCDLLDAKAILDLAELLGQGAEKYGEEEWRKIDTPDHLNHAMTHILAYQAGDNQDDHLLHAFCRLMMAVAIEQSD